MHTPYSHYQPRSVGSILNALYIYCGSRVAEQAIIRDNSVEWDDTIATYVWDEDTPIFTFISKNAETNSHWSEKQMVYKPFLRIEEPFVYRFESMVRKIVHRYDFSHEAIVAGMYIHGNMNKTLVDKYLEHTKMCVKYELAKMESSTFINMYMNGLAEPKHIDAHIKQWHNSKDLNWPLHAFLGLTEDEYSRFVENPDCLKSIIDDKINVKTNDM